MTTTTVPDDWADRWADFHKPIVVGRISVRPSWWDPNQGMIDHIMLQLSKIKWSVALPLLLLAAVTRVVFAAELVTRKRYDSPLWLFGDSLVRTRTVNAVLSSVFSPTFFNEFRAQWLRDQEPGRANTDEPEVTVRQGGQTVLVFGRNFFSPRETTIKRFQVANAVTWIQGAHTWKAGLDLNFDRIFNFFPGNFGGRYVFNSLAGLAGNFASVRALPELQTVRIQPSLTVRDVMVHRVQTVPPEATIRTVLDLMLRRRLHAVPVVGEKGEVLGLVTAADLMRALLPHIPRAGAEGGDGGEGPGQRRVRDIMTRSVLCVSEELGVSEVASMMINKDVEQVPVVQAGSITGMVTRADIIRKLFGRA